MNQRYRNDDEFGRRSREDEFGRRSREDEFGRRSREDDLQHQYAQPSPDARFERDRGPQRYHHDDNEYADNLHNSNGWNGGYRPDGSGRNGWEEPSRSFGSRSLGSRSLGQWQGNRSPLRQDPSLRNHEEWQWSRLPRGQDSVDYRDYGSNRDYSRPDTGAFRENPFGVGGRSFDGRNGTQSANLSFGHNGRQAAGFYADSQQPRGEHVGKGPKGYQRSDERIREDVCDRLAQDDALDARNITVTTIKGEVTLEGSVPDRFSKHRAEDIVDSVSGVSDINNRLKVDKGFFEDIGDRVLGNQDHSGHAGERPKENKNGHSSVSR
jgi:hypothetical protein